jgi:hypothetical protein
MGKIVHWNQFVQQSANPTRWLAPEDLMRTVATNPTSACHKKEITTVTYVPYIVPESAVRMRFCVMDTEKQWGARCPPYAFQEESKQREVISEDYALGSAQ